MIDVQYPIVIGMVVGVIDLTGYGQTVQRQSVGSIDGNTAFSLLDHPENQENDDHAVCGNLP